MTSISTSTGRADPRLAKYDAEWPRGGDVGFVAEDDSVAVGAAWSRPVRVGRVRPAECCEQLIGGVDFGEGPRWHDGALWYCDFFQRAICTVTPDGAREAVDSGLDDQTSGLGWLPDGRLLVVSMRRRRVLGEEGGTLVEHADLSSIAGGLCNEMVVDADGNAYVTSDSTSTTAPSSVPPTSRSCDPTAQSR